RQRPEHRLEPRGGPRAGRSGGRVQRRAGQELQERREGSAQRGGERSGGERDLATVGERGRVLVIAGIRAQRGRVEGPGDERIQAVDLTRDLAGDQEPRLQQRQRAGEGVEVAERGAYARVSPEEEPDREKR